MGLLTVNLSGGAHWATDKVGGGGEGEKLNFWEKEMKKDCKRN